MKPGKKSCRKGRGGSWLGRGVQAANLGEVSCLGFFPLALKTL